MRSLNMPIHGWQKVMGRLFLGWRSPRRPTLGSEAVLAQVAAIDAAAIFGAGRHGLVETGVEVEHRRNGVVAHIVETWPCR